MRGHSGVNDVAVVGVPDERSGELPRAYVVRKDRHVTEQSIVVFTRCKTTKDLLSTFTKITLDIKPQNMN